MNLNSINKQKMQKRLEIYSRDKDNPKDEFEAYLVEAETSVCI